MCQTNVLRLIVEMPFKVIHLNANHELIRCCWSWNQAGFHNLHKSLYFPARDKSRKTLYKLLAFNSRKITINIILQESIARLCEIRPVFRVSSWKWTFNTCHGLNLRFMYHRYGFSYAHRSLNKKSITLSVFNV